MKQKTFTLLFAIVASLGTMFASNLQIGGIWYVLDYSLLTATVTYHGSAFEYSDTYSGTVVIPETVRYGDKNYYVKSIGEYAFYNCSGLTSVTISNTVTSIGESAFSGCTGLTSAYISNSVKRIGESVFSGCTGLTSIEIPNSVTSIAYRAFYGCTGLTSVTIPNSVKSIGESAFSGCTGLTSVYISNSVTWIGGSAFSGCTGLTSVTIPNSVTSIGGSAFSGCSGLTSVTIGNSVTSIGDDAFSGCSGLTSVTIGNSVTSIGDDAFSGCTGLTSVTIPNSVTSIGGSAFSGCSGLTSVTIGNSVTSIGDDAFSGCSGLTSPVYNAHVFAYMPTTYSGTYTIPDGIKTIASSAFQNCSGLTSVTIPNSVTSIGAYAFQNCSGLTSVTIGNSIRGIGDYAFSGCKNLTFVSIDANAFVQSGSSIKNIFGAQVTEYIIGNSVTSIGKYAFQNCNKLTSVTIGNSVTSIGDDAFSGCSGLTSVTLDANTLVNKTYTWSSSIKDIFGEQVTKYIIGNSVTGIGKYAFAKCTGLTSITIPNSVTSIGESAFVGCNKLTSVALDANTLVNKTYQSDSSIKKIFGTQVTEYIIGNSVKYIGAYAFSGCKNLTSVTIPNSVTGIGSYAFASCSGLTSVTIPNSVTSIGNSAFSGCSGLTSVTIPNSVPSIGAYAFSGCSGLTSIEIPNNVKSIGNGAFSVCSGLTSVTIGDSVTSIGEKAFYGCTGLTSMTCYAAKPPALGSDVFFNVNCSQIPLYVPNESAAQYSVTAIWKEFDIRLLDPFNCTVNASATNGIVEGAGEYEAYSKITLKVIPENGYMFKRWSDGNTDNPRTIIIEQDTIFTAICEEFQEPANTVHLPYNESFSSSIGKFSIKNVNLGGINYVWALTSNYGMKASAYVNQSYATESWLVSPLISLYNTKDIVLSFDHAVNKGTTANLRVKISTDLGTSWSDLTVPKWPAGTNWDFVSTSLSLDAYANKVVQIAFIYKSTTSNCPTWEIKNFSIKGTVISGRPLPIDVEPAETSASVTWLTISNANSYELIIRDMNGNAICSIIFDAEGHVQSVTNYAPSRDNASQLEQANDFAYTVTGLTDDTDYNFILIGKDNEDKVITSYSGSFRTKSSSQGIEETPLDFDKPVKIIHDGQIFILREEHVYNTQGKMVK